MGNRERNREREKQGESERGKHRERERNTVERERVRQTASCVKLREDRNRSREKELESKYGRVDVRWIPEQLHSANDDDHGGVWHEVRSKRKWRPAESRDRVYTNSFKRQDRTGTWRNKLDVTTFYFSRFPAGIKEEDLWKIFQKWGKVWEVLFPSIRTRKARGSDSLDLKTYKMNGNWSYSLMLTYTSEA